MSKEDIKKAKAENAERIANIAYSGGGHIGQDDLETAFENGAEWRINSVWHDASEMPEKKFALVEYDCFPKGHGYLVVPDAREVIESITRWAYMEDLIPNMEE